MSGFGPVGSKPVASSGDNFSGTYISVTSGNVVISGITPALSGTDPVNLLSTNREVLWSASAVVNFTSTVREILRDPQTTTIFESIVVREVLRDPELIYVNSGVVIREVLRSGVPITSGGSVSILW